MKKLFFYTLIYVFSLQCFSQKIITVKAKEIQSIGIFPVISSISIIKSRKEEEIAVSEKNKIESEINEDSNETLQELMKMIDLPSNNFDLDSISKKIYVAEIEKYNFQIWYFYPESGIGRSKIKKIIESIKVSEDMVNLIKSKNQRYCLCFVNQGITRTIKSNKNRVIKNIALITSGVATIGLAGILFGESKFGVTSYALIIDSETKSVSNFYYNTSATDPISKVEMRNKQIFPIFEDYWVWYHQEGDIFKKIDRK